VPEFERSCAQLYNQADGLVVQNPHLVEYWENRGVRVPIEVIGRPIDPAIFSRPTTEDPWPESKRSRKRLLCVCRIDREKNLDALIDVFEKEIAGSEPEVTLTLIGDGFERPRLIERCRRSKYSNRIFFPGEVRHEDLRDWYAHADVFVYTSLSETFGNVVNEALWNGLPVVAFDDRLGISGQVESAGNGFLIEPSTPSASRDFAEAVLRLLRNQELRTRLGQEAKAKARRISHPDVVLDRYERFYERSMERVRREVSRPLIEAQGVSKAANLFEFTRHIVPWAGWSALLLGFARATVAFESAAHFPGRTDAAK
jgi:1,2-diacylglycerol 3-alpha-glucosyltransferase